MATERDPFRLQHAGDIREALIRLEGEDGAFELISHGRYAHRSVYAHVRSLNTDRLYLLIHDGTEEPGHAWRPVPSPDMAARPARPAAAAQR